MKQFKSEHLIVTYVLYAVTVELQFATQQRAVYYNLWRHFVRRSVL